MRHLSLIGLVAALGAILVSGASCSEETKFVALCSSDQQCIGEHGGNPNWRCEKAIGDCVCTGDLACVGEDEHCETFPGGDGRCHPNESCEWNQDCEGNTFCDVQDRHCRLTGCTDDLQCDLGEVCDSITKSCVPGCRSHGDCNLRDVCMCEDAAGKPIPCPACDGPDRSLCPVGQCRSNTCADDSFCSYGDFCVKPPAGSDSTPVCESGIAPETPFCGNCQREAGKTTFCGSDGPNFCLRDTSDPAGLASFCGVDCRGAGDAACPNGFSCHDILELTDASCRGDSQCHPKPNAPACAEDEDCPAGSRCKAGQCAGRCAIHEGGQSGFCGCVQDSDCSQQTCDNGFCSITRERCTPGSADTCRGQIMCVNNGNIGYCMVGRNCAPDEGITCTDVNCDQNPSGCGK